MPSLKGLATALLIAFLAIYISNHVQFVKNITG